jgi:hypothetical protein
LAVYRNDQVDFSFGAEIGAGGYLAPVKATADASGDLTTTTDTVSLPGAKTIGVASTSGAVVGEYIQIGTTSTNGTEVRKIVSFVTNDTITLNAPCGFYHASGVAVQTVDTTSSAGTMTGLAIDANTSHHMRFTPGAWESIDVPDPTMEIEPRYFLGAESKRAFYTAYKGQQSFSGTLSNFELLNGYPLRFPLGTVSTVGSDSGAGGSTVDGIIYAGQYEFDITSASGYVVDDYIQVDVGALAEVRKVVAVSSNNIWVDYPFLFEHADDVACNEVVSPYTHTIVEAVELPGISWQVKNRDSSETAANDWIRRYFGGKIGQATLTAEEGGTLRMSWESAPFLDMNHNQYISGSTVVNKFDASNLAATVAFPTSEPYYFSQGSITLFGVEFARITNFTININNNLEPRYFIRNDGSERTPSQIFEGRREYSMTATVVLPDSISATSTTNTIFKELLAEGDYGSGMAGFDIDLVFTRTASTDTFTINIPANQDGSSGTGGNNQGAFIRSANTSVSTENPVSTEVDILFRNMSAQVIDSEPVYP